MTRDPGALRDGWRLAVGTLSAVPVAPPSRVDARVARRAALLAPLAVLPVALAVGVVCWAGPHLGLPAAAVGLIGVAVVVLGNRALHVDGLADTADGLTASLDRERSLAVMQTGASGPAGVAAVVLVLGLQATGLAALAGSPLGAVLAGLAVCASRCALAQACVPLVPSARPGGLGAAFAGTVPVLAAVAAWALAAALLVTAVLAGTALDATGPDTSPLRAVLAVVVATVVVSLLLRRTVRRLGGMTGDVLGAAIETALAVLLVALA